MPTREEPRRTACSSSCSSTTRSTARCATAAASARCRTRRSRSGPGESRFVEEKRHFEKPIPISDLVLLDRERCIQCGRCTRFAAEIAGDPLIDFGGRGGTTEVITYPDEPFSSYFSGNTVQICPVGALTASVVPVPGPPVGPADGRDRRARRARSAAAARSQSTSNRIVRLLGVDSEPVNQGWLCDKGRYGYEWVHCRRSRARADGAQDRRARRGVVAGGARRGRGRVPAARSTSAAPGSIAVLGGARGTNEDAYAWARLAKGVLGTDNVDAQLGDGLPAEVVLGLPRAAISDLDRARGIVLARARPQGRAPGAAPARAPGRGRPRRAGHRDRAERPAGSRARRHAVLRHAPGEAGAIARAVRPCARGRRHRVGRRADRARGRRRSTVATATSSWCSAASRSPNRRPRSSQAAAALAALPDVKFLSALRRGNVHGALDLGLTPGFLPGRVTLDAGARSSTPTRGERSRPRAASTPPACSQAAATARSTRSCCSAPTSMPDFPDRDARHALRSTRRGSSSRSARSPHDAAARADVFLPTSVWGEKTGSTTNLEGRVMRVARLVTPEGTTMDDWRIAAELAAAVRHRLRVRHRRRRAGRDRTRCARVRGRRRRRCSGEPVTAPSSRSPSSPTRSCCTRARRQRRTCRGSRSHPASPSDETHLSSVGTGAVEASGTGSSSTIKPGLAEADDALATTAGRSGARRGRRRRRRPPRLPSTSGTGPRPRHRPSRRDAYSLRLVAARTLYDAGSTAASSPPLAALAPGLALVVHPSDLARLGVAAEGDDVRVTSARNTSRCRCAPTPRSRRAPAFMAFAQSGPSARTTSSTSPISVTELRVETTTVTIDAARRRGRPAVLRAASNLTVVLIVIGKTIAVFVLLLLSVLLYIWFLRKVIAQMQNRIGPDRAGPVRAAPDAWPTASSCSSRSSRGRRPPTGGSSSSRRTSRSMPAFLAFAIVPIGGVVDDRRAQDVPAARRPPVRDPVAARDVGPRALRRDARGVVVGVEVPAPRLGPRVGAAAQLRGRVRARDRRRAGPGEHALDAWHRQPAGLGRRHRVDLQRRLVLAAGDRGARDLRDRGRRRDQPPAVRPRRGGAGAHRRVHDRVHGHPVRDLLPRRVHEPDHHVARSRSPSSSAGPNGPGARLPRRRTAGSTRG